MPSIGVSYNPALDLFCSGANQTALLLAELFSKLGYNVSLIDSKNNDIKWWDNYPKMDNVKTENIYQVSGLDYFIDIDGVVHPDNRNKIANTIIVFLRTFVQFNELDSSIYPEHPYVPRSFDNVKEIWCWDILNPEDTLASIQTLFPCPIRTVPFIWSPSVISHFIKDKKVIRQTDNTQWTVHIAEKNNSDTSSPVLPLVAIRELTINKVLDAKYECHNMERIIENRFLKENVLNNIEISKLPVKFEPKTAFYKWLASDILFSHSRFVPLRIGLLNAVWMGLPLIHNSSYLRELHPILGKMFYFGNEVRGMCRAFKAFTENPDEFYEALEDIRATILAKWGIETNLEKWREVLGFTPKVDIASETIPIQTSAKEIIIAFSDMWPGFNYNNNFITDSLCHYRPDIKVKGILWSSNIIPNLLVFGPYSKEWKSVPASIPKVFFSCENWGEWDDPSVKLYLTSSRMEDDRHMRIPTWMTFIDWFSDSKELPQGCEDNPIRLPVHFALTPHPVTFKDRKDFCGFVVSNPICSFRNDTFQVVNNYKRVDSGGALYNNIGGQLTLKYPGGGCGDISKYHFFATHKFSISFENSQADGYITEKLLHAKMAGCLPIYWGDKNTDSDFVPNSFINLSNIDNPDKVLEVIKLLESKPEMCSIIASTPLLNEEKQSRAVGIISSMAKRLFEVAEFEEKPQKSHNRVVKTFVINLDTRKDRWDNLCKAEPYITSVAERFPAVNGKDIQMTPYIYSLFKNNSFHWKKSVVGCNLSHINIWKQIAALPITNANELFLILEDDVRFLSDIKSDWDNYASSIPTDAELLYLGGVLPPNRPALPNVLEPINDKWAKIKPNQYFSRDIALPLFHFCTYSYLISRGAVEKILHYLQYSDIKFPTVVDHFLGQQSLQLTTYVATPLLTKCFQDDDPVYQTSQFNNTDRKDSYDSDIWNNTECFTQDDIARMTTTLKMYYLQTEQEFDLYERNWIECIYGRNIELLPLSSFDKVVEDGAWFIVQRPYSDLFNTYFEKLQTMGISFKVLHISDEFCKDNISFYRLSMCRAVVRNYVREDLPQFSHIITVPLGYHHKSQGEDKSFLSRKLVWSFHGTNWFGRKNILEGLAEIVPNNCHLLSDWNHPNMTKEAQYLSTLGNSKFCPILRGNNVETFRLYETLEAGVIPLYIRSDNDTFFWQFIFDKLGLVELDSWDKAKSLIQYFMANPEMAEKYRMALLQKWSAWKAEIKLKVQQHI